MYFGLKIAHSALTGNYRSDQAFTGRLCAFWRWQMDVPAPNPLLWISFLEGCVITVQMSWNPAWAWLLSKEKEGSKSTPRMYGPQQLHGVGTRGWGTTRGCLGCGRAAQCLEAGAEGTDFVLCLWQVLCRKCSPGDREQSPLWALCTVWLSHRPSRLLTHIQGQALLWLEAGLPGVASFPVPRFGAGIRSFTASVPSWSPHQGAVTTGSIILAWGWRAEC